MKNDRIKISNPLTIIGLFAGIAEVAGTIVLPFVSETLQKFFIWYVMGFPILLVGIFFFTLIKYPKNLYAPSDFKDEANFLSMLQNVEQQIEKVKDDNPELNDKLEPIIENINEMKIAGMPHNVDLQFKMLDLIAENRDTGMDITQLREEMGCTNYVLSKCIESLIRGGFMHRDFNGKNYTYYPTNRTLTLSVYQDK